MPEERPPASKSREESVRQVFDLSMSPEEFAARHSHRILCSSFDEYEYSDPIVDRWIRRFHFIVLRSPELLQFYRQQYLTAEEIAAIEDELNDPRGL